MECMIQTSLREPVRPQPVGPQTVDPTALHKSRCLGSFCRQGVISEEEEEEGFDIDTKGILHIQKQLLAQNILRAGDLVR